MWLLGLRLGVPGYVAPLVAPAVDLSVLGLLVAIRELAMRGASRAEIRPARRLLVFASLVTLALNIAEPVIAGNLGKAACDAVGPLLPVGLAEKKGVDKVTLVVIDVPAALDVPQNLAPKAFKDAGIEYELVRVPPGTADMTPQMQSAVAGHPGIVFVVGNDSFCISAFNGLRAVGYDGQISAISQCITDATRKAVSSDILSGMVVATLAPAGGTDPSAVLYQTAMETYGDDIDISSTTGRTCS